jgi:hypothetical protein
MAAERLRLERLPLIRKVKWESSREGADTTNLTTRRFPTHVFCKGRPLSVPVEIGYVAHAVTKTSAIPILLETAARASLIFAHGWGVAK